MKINKNISSFDIFKSFLLAGTFTVAGGLAMLPVLKTDFVDNKKAISEDDFMHYAALSQTIPGIIAVNFGCLIGEKTLGKKGVFAAVLGSIMPAFLLMLFATILYVNVPQDGILSFVFIGIRASSSSCVAVAGLTMLHHVKKSWVNISIIVISILSILVLNISSPLIILVAGVFGALFMREGAK